jgi:hypothetical protein
MFTLVSNDEIILINLIAISNSQVVSSTWLGYCVSGGVRGCIIRGFCRNSTMVASQLMVVFLATERFIALRFPFRYQNLLTPRRVVTVAISLYLYSVSMIYRLKLYHCTNQYIEKLSIFADSLDVTMIEERCTFKNFRHV